MRIMWARQKMEARGKREIAVGGFIVVVPFCDFWRPIRSASRNVSSTDDRFFTRGFRIARSLD